MTADTPHDPHLFSLIEGGPFIRVSSRLRLHRPGGGVRAFWAALVLWLPLALGSIVRAAFGMAVDPTVLDVSVHLRLLVALPLMLMAERLVDPACRGAISSLCDGGFCDRGELEGIVETGERLRDARLPEAVLLGVAMLVGQLVLWQIFGSTGLVHGAPAAGPWSFPRLWYALVALPATQFVMYRFLWRWLIWFIMLVRLARQPLVANAMHPDLAAGLGPLAWPVSAFSVFVLAVATVLAGAWETQLLAHHTTRQQLVPGMATFLLLALVIALGPLLMFCGHVYRARRRALFEYGEFADAYTRRFRAKWLAGSCDAAEALGSQDIQALNDLGGGFQVVAKTRVLLFEPRRLIGLWLAVALPMLPLFANAMTLEQLLKRLLGVVVGGLPT